MLEPCRTLFGRQQHEEAAVGVEDLIYLHRPPRSEAEMEQDEYYKELIDETLPDREPTHNSKLPSRLCRKGNGRGKRSFILLSKSSPGVSLREPIHWNSTSITWASDGTKFRCWEDHIQAETQKLIVDRS
jgi:hypothetical protein